MTQVHILCLLVIVKDISHIHTYIRSTSKGLSPRQVQKFISVIIPTPWNLGLGIATSLAQEFFVALRIRKSARLNLVY